jgi:hypothetical protein
MRQPECVKYTEPCIPAQDIDIVPSRALCDDRIYESVPHDNLPLIPQKNSRKAPKSISLPETDSGTFKNIGKDIEAKASKIIPVCQKPNDFSDSLLIREMIIGTTKILGGPDQRHNKE